MTPPALAARARAAAVPAPLRQPIAPRRVSGPARRPHTVPPSRRSRGALVRVLDAPFLDRLIRGRVWIGLVAFALLGIVAMQVAILQLGASIGRSVTEIQHLTQANQAAATTIARDEPGGDVSSEAASLGMVYPPAGNIVYLHYASGDGAQAADSFTLPSAPLFTPAAASLTAPIDTAASAPVASTDPSASADSTTQTTSGATDTSATTTPPATSQSGGAAASIPAAPSSASDLGAGGGSAAPGG